MAELKIAGRTITPTKVEKFALTNEPGQEPWSRGAADAYIDKSYLNDNLFLTDGKDAYVVSKKGMNLGPKFDGKAAKLDGKDMTVFRTNDYPDTLFQRAKVTIQLAWLQVKFMIFGGGALDRTFG